jgi:hypothetical protein
MLAGHRRSASAFWNARNASGVGCSRGVICTPSSLDVITIGLDETLLKPKYGNDIETSAYKS